MKKNIGIVIVDGASLHNLLDAVANTLEKGQTRLRFHEFKKTCDKYVRKAGFEGRALETRIYSGVDPNSDAQTRLAQSWESAGFGFMGLDFRTCYPSPSATDPTARQATTHLAAPIAYSLGTLRRHENVTVLVVSHAFDFAGPLADLQNNGAKVGLACFKSFLDQRWIQRKTIDVAGGPIPFFDLEEDAPALFGFSMTDDLSAAQSKTGLGF